ncbi:MAG: hypothetical protein ACOC2F_07820 [Bacteroidota bacterium]
MMYQRWNSEEIIRAYRETCTGIGKVITSKEFDDYESLPSYVTMMKHFDSIQELRYKAGLISEDELTPKQKSDVMTEIERQLMLCEDCVEHYPDCGKIRKECIEEAREYFDFIESHKIARRV